MTRSLNPGANGLRLLLVLAVIALLGIVLIGFNAGLPLRAAGIHSAPPFLAPAPNPGSQPAAGVSANQPAQATTPVVIGPAMEQPAPVGQPPSSASVQPVPYQGQPAAPGTAACPNLPPGRAIAACANP